MKLATVACLAVLIQMMSAAPLQQPAPAKGSIEGVVTRAGTGDPIPGARVTLTKTATTLPQSGPRGPLIVVEDPAYNQAISRLAESGRITSAGSVFSVLTDSQGRFAIRELDAGAYRISAGANGYAKQEYGQRTAGGQGTAVNLNAGQTASVGISLTQAGSVSGRIRDNTGQPVTGMQVQLLKPTYNANGQRSFQSAGSSRSDDRGEYRLFWITPGRYLVMASSTANSNVGAVISSPNEMAGDSIAPTFYPGSADISQAVTIDVKPGADIGGVDVIVNRQPSYRIRGRLIDSRNGQAPITANVTLATPSLTGGISSSSPNQTYNGRDGMFDLRDVSPGPHILRASLPVSSNTVTLANAGTVSAASQAVYGQVLLNVTGDMDGVVLTLSSGVSISGRLAMEGPPTAGPQGQGSLTLYRVQLRPSDNGVLTSIPGGLMPQSQATNADGMFRIDSVASGEFRVSFAPLNQDVYLKQARFNQNDVLNKPMQFSSSDSGTLEVLLSSRGGQIDGMVTNERQQGVPSIEVVLIPDRQRDRGDLYKVATSDASGHFNLRGIAPGDYHLFAWEAIDPYAYFDPDLLKQYESKGKPVHIAESAKENIDVLMIPSEP